MLVCSQREILNILDAYEKANDSPWDRNKDIEHMMMEWDAHNDVYDVWANVRCLHVNLDNPDAKTTYLGFLWRAVYETLFK